MLYTVLSQSDILNLIKLSTSCVTNWTFRICNGKLFLELANLFPTKTKHCRRNQIQLSPRNGVVNLLYPRDKRQKQLQIRVNSSQVIYFYTDKNDWHVFMPHCRASPLLQQMMIAKQRDNTLRRWQIRISEGKFVVILLSKYY